VVKVVLNICSWYIRSNVTEKFH